MTPFYLLAAALLSLNLGTAIGIYIGLRWRELDNKRRRWLRKRRARRLVRQMLHRAKAQA